MKIENVNINSIKPYENNPRFNDQAIAPVAQSIKQFGFQQPIVVDKDLIVIAGHTRLKAAKLLKLTQVPITVANELTPEQVAAYRLADNKVSEVAEWEDDLLKIELDAIKEIDMEDFGFDLNVKTMIDKIKDNPTGDGNDMQRDFIVLILLLKNLM